jgi:hypothetical protein
MKQSYSNSLEKRSSISTDVIPKDTVDSIRLTKRPHRISAPTIDWDTEKALGSVTDIDIDALDAEFERLSLDFKDQLAELRKHPNNLSLRHTLTSTKEALLRIKTWSSLLSTADGLAMIKKSIAEQRGKEFIQRKYEVDEILKISKAQSAVDLCFLMDCTGSMRKYLDATKSQIRQLTEAIVQLFSSKPYLAFVGYRDIDDNMEKIDFTDDENVFQEFLNNIQAIGGDDTCEDVFGKCRKSDYKIFINRIICRSQKCTNIFVERKETITLDYSIPTRGCSQRYFLTFYKSIFLY